MLYEFILTQHAKTKIWLMEETAGGLEGSGKTPKEAICNMAEKIEKYMEEIETNAAAV